MEIKTANPNFFVVKINKQKQAQRKDGAGAIKHASTFLFGKAGMQRGEIVAIGKLAHLVIPRAKVGGILIFSWKVEFSGEKEDGSQKLNHALVYEDLEYNYYTVTVSEYKGRSSETYAYFDENGLITHPSYVMLKDKPAEDTKLMKKNNLYVYQNWQLSEDVIRQKIEFNKQWVYSLSITYASQSQLRDSDARQTKELITAIEKENAELTKLVNIREKAEAYEVAYCSPLHEYQPGDKVIATNIFFLEKIIIKQAVLLIGKAKHIHGKQVEGALIPLA